MKNFLFALLLLGALIPVLVRPLTAQPYGLTSRPSVGPFLNGAVPESAPTLSGNWSAVVAFSRITFMNIGVNKRPVIDYSHSEGFAVIGGYVYRGSRFTRTALPAASSSTSTPRPILGASTEHAQDNERGLGEPVRSG
jgi:hypothetical protein